METITKQSSRKTSKTGKVSVARDARIDQPLNRWKCGHKATSTSDQPFDP